MTRCTKARFLTSHQADRALEQIRKRGRPRPEDDKIPTRTYLCEFCKGWHLTSAPQ